MNQHSKTWGIAEWQVFSGCCVVFLSILGVAVWQAVAQNLQVRQSPADREAPTRVELAQPGSPAPTPPEERAPLPPSRDLVVGEPVRPDGLAADQPRVDFDDPDESPPARAVEPDAPATEIASDESESAPTVADSPEPSISLDDLREHWLARFDPTDDMQLAAEREALIAGERHNKSTEPATQSRINLAIREYVAKGFREESLSEDEVDEALGRARKAAAGDPRLEFAEGLVAQRQGKIDAALARFQRAADGKLLPAAFAWLAFHDESGEPDDGRTLTGIRRIVLQLSQEPAGLTPTSMQYFARELGGYRECIGACRNSNEFNDKLKAIDELVAERWSSNLVESWDLGRQRIASSRQRLVRLQQADPESLASVVRAHLDELNAGMTAAEKEAAQSENELNDSKSDEESAGKQLLASIRKDQTHAKALVRQGALLRQDSRSLSIPRKTAQRIIGTRRVRRRVKGSRSRKNDDRTEYETVEEPIYEWYEPDNVRDERLQRLARVEQQLREVGSAHAGLIQNIRTAEEERKRLKLETKQDSQEFRGRRNRHSQLKETIEEVSIHAPTPENIDRWMSDPGYWVRFDPEQWKDRLMSVLK